MSARQFFCLSTLRVEGWQTCLVSLHVPFMLNMLDIEAGIR